MTKEQADAIFEHHDAIAKAGPGTRLVTTGEIEVQPTAGGTVITLPAGEHLSLTSACKLWAYAHWAKGPGVIDIYMPTEEFHKLEIIREAVPQPAATAALRPDRELSPFAQMRTVAADLMAP